jgi:hypothetical protein
MYIETATKVTATLPQQAVDASIFVVRAFVRLLEAMLTQKELAASKWGTRLGF